MQALKNWNPLKLPQGSVRALLTLGIVGLLLALMLLQREIPIPLIYIVLIVLGDYFGFRACQVSDEPKPGPLYLPRGSVRTVIILAFGTVGFFLWRDGNLELDTSDRNFTVLVMVAALLLGFIVRRFEEALTGGEATKARRWFDNSKAVLAILAVGVFALSCFDSQAMPAGENVGVIVAPIIIFYFGSRR